MALDLRAAVIGALSRPPLPEQIDRFLTKLVGLPGDQRSGPVQESSWSPASRGIAPNSLINPVTISR